MLLSNQGPPAEHALCMHWTEDCMRAMDSLHLIHASVQLLKDWFSASIDASYMYTMLVTFPQPPKRDITGGGAVNQLCTTSLLR